MVICTFYPQLLNLDEDLRKILIHGNLEWLCYLSSTSKLSNILCTFSFNCMIFSFNLFIICKSYATLRVGDFRVVWVKLLTCCSKLSSFIGVSQENCCNQSGEFPHPIYQYLLHKVKVAILKKSRPAGARPPQRADRETPQRQGALDVRQTCVSC